MSQLLKEAQTIANERGKEYSHPSENLGRIGRMWGAILGVADIPPETVALMMDSVKTSRLISTPFHFDSLLDKIGYVRCYEMIGEHNKKKG